MDVVEEDTKTTSREVPVRPLFPCPVRTRSVGVKESVRRCKRFKVCGDDERGLKNFNSFSKFISRLRTYYVPTCKDGCQPWSASPLTMSLYSVRSQHVESLFRYICPLTYKIIVSGND